MNISHLKYAVEVAKTRSISKAAENLYMGQPNLSRAIKDLEESVGIVIFKRTPKGMTVTPDGEIFLQYAGRILSRVAEMERYYESGKNPTQSFSVCVPRASYIAHAFAAFSKTVSADAPMELYYKETNSLKAITKVTSDEYNLGIIRYQAVFDHYFRGLFEESTWTTRPLPSFRPFC